jgi:hypothetical protein
MIQFNEIQQSFNHIEQTIHEAAQACESTSAVPMGLKDCIQQLDSQSDNARKVMQMSQDEDQIRQCVNDLEQLGDRAKEECERAGKVDDLIKEKVMHLHHHLSDLKHQLH